MHAASVGAVTRAQVAQLFLEFLRETVLGQERDHLAVETRHVTLELDCHSLLDQLILSLVWKEFTAELKLNNNNLFSIA